MIVTIDQLAVYFLIVSRMTGIMSMSPFFSNKQIFGLGKMAFVLWASMLFIFVVPIAASPPSTSMSFLFAMLNEFIVGALIGFTADILISGIEFAGALMDTQAGLSVASLLDPSTGRNASLFEQLLKWTTLMMFLQIDGHHMVVSAVHQSFDLLPAGAPVNLSQGARYVLGFGKDIFMIGVSLASPIILVIFLVDFAFGMLNRVAEQINVFQLGFQIKPTVALIVFFAITPGLINSILTIMEGILTNIIRVLSFLQVTV